ncbi:MAG: formylglycine-generating enzyme family protein [Leptolyngbya sp. SIO1E4]|nr:formylglycine-generating enzyme family protein [Leptolyngbya sp. SIO1E4]
MHPRDVDIEGIDESEIELSSEREIGVELIDIQLIEVGEAHIVFRAKTIINFAVSVGYFDYGSYRSPEQEMPHWYRTWSGQTLNGSVFIDLQLFGEDFEEGLFDAEIDLVELRLDAPVLVSETTDLGRSASDIEDDLSSRSQSIEVRIATLERQANHWHIVYRTGEVQRYVEPLSDSVGLELIAIPGGTFRMGSPEDEPERKAERESPQHDVTVAPFFMGRYPVTQAQWRAVANLPQVNRELNPDPSGFKGNNRPVERIYWHDAVEFCARLTGHTDLNYRLPSEAEWEYACRANTTTPFHFGNMITTDVANYNGRAYANGPEGERRGETTPVDHFDLANAFGLSDMHGNVDEWCADHWHENYQNAPTDGSAWIEGGYSSGRILRGGSWDFNPRSCRSAYRFRNTPDNISINFGFRVVFSPPGPVPSKAVGAALPKQ